MSTRCQRALSKVTDVSNLLGRTRTMWSGYSIMISSIYVNIVYMLMLQTAETRGVIDWPLPEEELALPVAEYLPMKRSSKPKLVQDGCQCLPSFDCS